MKIAFCGKGGVGKTALASAMVRLLSEDSRKVLAVDADPNSNLARALGFPVENEIVPIVHMKDLIYERMDIKGDPKGAFYKLNPKIDDIPQRFIRKRGNIGLIVMGTVDAGGSGCVCPESTFLRELLKHMVLNGLEDIVMDMEAGIEHLGRSTAISMDCLLVVAEPTAVSIETARRVKRLSEDLRMKAYYVGNKIREKEDELYIYESLGKDAVIGMVSYDDKMTELNKRGSIMDLEPGEGILLHVGRIRQALGNLTGRMKNEQKKITG